MNKVQDQKYLDILVQSIRVCQQYKPKLGRGAKSGYSLQDFQELYQADTFYSWLGLDNPLMYAAHKAAGGMTSIYRQIGFGCEILYRKILQDTLCITEEDVMWSYTIPKANGKTRTLSLDAQIPIEKVRDIKTLPFATKMSVGLYSPVSSKIHLLLNRFMRSQKKSSAMTWHLFSNEIVIPLRMK